MAGALCAHYRLIDKYVKNAHYVALSSQPPLKKKINKVLNSITYSIILYDPSKSSITQKMHA